MKREAFAKALSDAYPRLWYIAAGLCGDRALADDIIQEAALAALKRIQDFRPGTSFSAWIATFIKHIAQNHNRKTFRQQTTTLDPVQLDRRPRTDSDFGEFDTAALIVSGELGPDQNWFDDDVSDALTKLSEESRVCLLLRTVGELSYAEIAELLQVPEGTAMSHVHRAKQSLRESLRDSGCPERVGS